ncbi:MAG: archaellin/type IV pilin N-terminal domain-containing protein [Nanoarchaeota archaeon]
MEKKKRFRNKRGISTVVSSLLMIMLVIIAVVIIWGAVRSLINVETEGTSSCSKIYGKITINSLYTCYNYTSPGELQFSIKIGDINIDRVLVAISSEGATESFEITNNKQPIEGLKNYSSGEIIILPKKNGGMTYRYSTPTKPNLIEVAPVIGEKQCEVTDSLSEIDNCNILI